MVCSDQIAFGIDFWEKNMGENLKLGFQLNIPERARFGLSGILNLDPQNSSCGKSK